MWSARGWAPGSSSCPPPLGGGRQRAARGGGPARGAGAGWRRTMKLTVLGSDGSWPGAGGATSGYLVQHEGFSLWLDAGTGTMAKLQEYVDISDLGAVAISHGHADHY